MLVEAGRYGAAASHVVQAADPGDEEAVETLREALRRAEASEHHREALALLDALLTMLPAGDRRWLQVLEVMPLTPDWVVDHRADANAEVGVRAMRRADQVLERSGGHRPPGGGQVQPRQPPDVGPVRAGSRARAGVAGPRPVR